MLIVFKLLTGIGKVCAWAKVEGYWGSELPASRLLRSPPPPPIDFPWAPLPKVVNTAGVYPSFQVTRSSITTPPVWDATPYQVTHSNIFAITIVHHAR